MDKGQDNWAQLVSTADFDSEPFFIAKRRFLIGRSKVADLSLCNNKMVSGTHCIIGKDEHGEAWIQDTSTNGTLLNLSTKLIGKRAPLNHGDEIHLVYKKGSENNVSYMFQDLAKLAAEELDETPDSEGYSGDTLEATSETDKEMSFADAHSSKKRKLEQTQTMSDSLDFGDTQPPKKQKQEDSEKDKAEATPEVPTKSCGSSLPAAATAGATKGPEETEESDLFEDSLICLICQEIFHNCVSLQPCLHSFCAGCYSDWMSRSQECPSCRGVVERVNKNHLVNGLVETYLKKYPGKARPAESLKELDEKNKISKDGFKPSKPKKTLSELIDEDSDGDNEEDVDEDDLSSSSSDEQEAMPLVGGLHAPVFPAPPVPFAGQFGTTLFGNYIPPRTLCRQCPGYRPPAFGVGSPSSNLWATINAVGNGVTKVINKITGKADEEAGPSTGAATADGAGSSTCAAVSLPDEKVMPVAPPYVCGPAQVHILCQCCLQPMPDRRTTHPMQCQLCYRFYCHGYWGCMKADCQGCAGKLQEFNFGKKCLDNLLFDNTFESDILKNYLTTKGMTTKDLLVQCCNKLDSRTYSTLDSAARGISSKTVCCFACGLRNFKEMAYQYRKDIPKSSLPDAVTSRPDCHWGKNCRTQRNKMHHAANFNHICHQTKTS